MKDSKKTNNRILVLVFLHVLLGLFALSDVASKYAALSEPLSLRFFICYGIVLVILAVYALGWQQVIKRMPLSSAYANRAVTIIWGIFWGAALFGESVTPGKIIGAAIIMAGIVLFAVADNEDADDGREVGSSIAAEENEQKSCDLVLAAAKAEAGASDAPDDLTVEAVEQSSREATTAAGDTGEGADDDRL